MSFRMVNAIGICVDVQTTQLLKPKFANVFVIHCGVEFAKLCAAICEMAIGSKISR